MSVLIACAVFQNLHLNCNASRRVDSESEEAAAGAQPEDDFDILQVLIKESLLYSPYSLILSLNYAVIDAANIMLVLLNRRIVN